MSKVIIDRTFYLSSSSIVRIGNQLIPKISSKVIKQRKALTHGDNMNNDKIKI
jgi:hypothetical protein